MRTLVSLTVSHRSTITTESAPGGIGAPVMIRAHCPDATDLAGVRPAVISSMTSKTIGPQATSAAITA